MYESYASWWWWLRSHHTGDLKFTADQTIRDKYFCGYGVRVVLGIEKLELIAVAVLDRPIGTTKLWLPVLVSIGKNSMCMQWAYAEVIALYRSCPAVSQIWALIVFPSTWMLLVANSTPMVLLLSKLNSFLVNLDNKLLFPTPESPIRTTEIDAAL